MGHPWWCSGSESVCQHRKHRFSPWPGKIPHAMGQRSPYTESTGACPQILGATREATTIRGPHTAAKGSPPSTHLEKAQGKQGRPRAAKNKQIKF